MEKLVPDTSVIIEGLVSDWIKKKKISFNQILIHEAVIAELEHQANENKAIGFLGLTELETINKLSVEKHFEMIFMGKRPSNLEIKHVSIGEIDSMIVGLAYSEGATLFTADKVQAKSAHARGIRLLFVELESLHIQLKLESFFDSQTMSVHLRENVTPFAKKGRPGGWEFVKIRDEALTREEIQDISREIIEEASHRKDGFIEIERPGSTIIQLGNFRIVITKPPFSDGWEITAVRPVKRLSLGDYTMKDKLRQRIAEQAEGILVAGAPGMGKSTFAQALAEHYASNNKIVKTVEAPRDLILPETITQYSISHGDAQEIHDILLLSRPDYTIFDEMRNTNDFKLFADLRLSGVGMIGVVHATNPVDAIQRFVGRIELGVIPQIIDTVIFIKNGEISKVLSLNMTVKVPNGMTEADLARPVVVVNDFDTGRLEYELYSYGEETVVVPVRGGAKVPSHQLAERSIEQELQKAIPLAKAEMVSDHKCVVYAPEEEIPGLIGKQGKNIEALEKRLGLSIDVQQLKKESSKKELTFTTQISKKYVQVFLDHSHEFKDVDIYVGDDYLLSAKAGKGGMLKIHRGNKIGKILTDALNIGDKVRVIG
ncbi:Flp pilus assembly complex ATPase component TadA [Candidatus Woesearchaeota archaeon]|nr:Flp pilus assembly complex ATPase component TadA [Candidatus Woesearchaeota archaeon]